MVFVPVKFSFMQPDIATRFPLRPARVHEVFGPSALGFAMISATSSAGCLLWVRQAWHSDVLQPLGLVPFLDPARLLMARTPDQTDSLAVAEEALRDGAIPFVVIEFTRPLDLREGRRLQLAARAGGTTGLCIIPEGMGSNAAETRWRVAPVFDLAREDSTLMRWEITKNKSGTFGVWDVQWDLQTRRLHVVSASGLRAGSAGAPD
ncbi:MAG: ImuA family protein [Paracoccus sp. (in: a-proteobacteria)]|uniref:ImuA family protein n=1 Tax=Paracoccus sp. TaxID=267 RepID=UPI003919F264